MTAIETLHETALKNYEEKNLDKALEIYNEIIKLNPIDEVALACVRDIYEEKDDRFNYYLARANVNIAQNKLEYAISDTKKAIAIDMDNIDAKRKLARLYKVSKQNLKAIDEFSKILASNEKDFDAYFELVDIYMMENSIESAIPIAKEGVEQFPDNAGMKNMLAQLYFRANDYESALNVVSDEMFKAKILLQKGDNEKAKEILNKFNPNSLDDIQKRNYYVLMAQYLYNTNDFENSLSNIEEYVKLSGPDAVSFQMKALIYEEKNDMFNAYLNWGFCKKCQNRFDEAIVEFNHAYQLNKTNKTVLFELAKLYMEQKERYVAMEFYQKIYDIDGDTEAKNILAEFYYSEGDFKKAEEYGKVKEKSTNNTEQEEEFVGFLDRIINFFSKNK